MFHLRQAHGGREVDVVLEAPDGRVVGIEIKAAAAPGPDAPRRLLWMRDQLGDALVWSRLQTSRSAGRNS